VIFHEATDNLLVKHDTEWRIQSTSNRKDNSDITSSMPEHNGY